MQITVTTAPQAARKLCKSAVFVQESIRKASNAESKAVPGARAERERLSASFARDHSAAETAIAQTRTKANSFDRAALVLRTGDTASQPDPMAALAALAVRLGANAAPLAEACSIAAERGADAARRAEDRMDEHDNDLHAAALQAALCARLPDAGFDRHHPSVKSLNAQFLLRTDAAKKRRKSS